MKSETLNKEFDCNIVHLGLRLDDNLHQYDKWMVTIEGQDFDYTTGIGFRKPKKKAWERGMKNYHGFKDEASYYLNNTFMKERANLTEVNKKIVKYTDAVKPKLDDVLYSLIIDSDVLNQNFHDWCDNFGYDTDSRKALEVYESCIKNAHKVTKFINNIDEAREKFQDY